MFLTTLHVAHIDRKNWRLTKPLVWEGQWDYLIIKSGFVTDFASIPKPVRWLLDNSGRNSEAAVLHDAVWRESMRGDDSRIDPWHADGIFRRALRETGSTALARGLMWFAVRAAAMAHGRMGRLGPSIGIKLLQLLAIFVLSLVTVFVPTVIALAGLLVYWTASWLVAIVWRLAFERRRFKEPANWPWPFNKRRRVSPDPFEGELLVIINKGRSPEDPLGTGEAPGDFGPAEGLEELLAEKHDVTNEEIDNLVTV